MERLHFLHIRKTGGTAIKHALANAPAAFELLLHPHEKRLMDIPAGEPVFFFLRDPVTRFVSGFNSRKRQGMPRYHYPWSDGEREAFARFPTADTLASALTSSEARTRDAAEQAMRDIPHISSRYGDWLGNAAYLETRIDDLFFIGFQERLEADLARLTARLGLPLETRSPNDPLEAHRTPPGFPTALSPSSIATLHEVYRDDILLVRFCEELGRD
jgi:Sulfotransferase family